MECMCSLCLDSLFSVNTDVSVTPCGHLFHKTCIANSMQNNLKCPNCNTVLRENMVKKIHPDVFDELVYSDCSNKTNKFLAKVFDYQKEKRILMVKIIKKLDKENTSLKETNKSNQENLQTCKFFLKCFQKETKNLQQKSKILELENNTLLAELRKINNDEEVNSVSKDSHMEKRKQINNISSDDSCLSIVSKGLLSFCLSLVNFHVF